MRKFVSKFIIFIVIIAVVTVSVNWVYVKRDKSDPNHINKFYDIPSDVQICNFGSSHGLYGYNYEDIEDTYSCFNFGLSSQTISYDYRLFEEYGDCIGNGTIVFITVSYFSLFGKGEVNDGGFESKNKRYYAILPATLIKEYDLKTDFFTNYLPALVADTGVLAKTLVGKSVDNNEVNWQRVASDIDVSADAEAAYGRHIKNRYDENGCRIINQ